MAEKDVSFRALAKRAREVDEVEGITPERKGLARGTIGNIASGDDKPSARALAVIARALGEEPEVFVEYRLAMARAALDEREVGLDRALKNLERFAPDPEVVEAQAVRDFTVAYRAMQPTSAEHGGRRGTVAARGSRGEAS